ncbi:MAG: 5-formyltetrahydrofolate cyclo-ligase [Eikenella sp.]|nr:5-formyltetrahydrofolate cyclo-ligase [Eikenella sp.]
MVNQKSLLRGQLRRMRQSLPLVARRRAERRIACLLKGYLKRGKRLAVYWPVGSELRLDGLVRAARRRGVRLYLPYIEAGALRLWFTPYPEQGGAERFRRRAPAIPQFQGKKIRAHCLHGMIIPLVGVDERGCRLGQGGGYYDVTLAATRGRLQPLKIGVGFACQQVACLPAEAHDVRLDIWVSEDGRRDFRGRRHADCCRKGFRLPETQT